MTKEIYLEISQKYKKNIIDYGEAINEQYKLANQFRQKLSNLKLVEDRYNKLLKIVSDKIRTYNPKIYKDILKYETGLDQKVYVISEAIKQTSEYNEIIQIRNKIPETKELDKLNLEFSKATYELLIATYNQDKKLAEDRKNLFTQEYLDKMDNLADNGLCLYFLETPDLPILEYSEDLICEYLLIGDNSLLKLLLNVYLISDNPNQIDKRKSEDLQASLILLDKGNYRACSRNIFALLEREHKNCANIFEGYFKKKKEFKNGYQRSEKIEEIVNNFNDEYYKKIWKKVDYNYKLICNGTSPVINRNVIIHGDYDNDKIDVSKSSIVKLLLLWLNMVILTNYLESYSYLIEDFDRLLPYISYLLAKKEK